jgi:hypothetical protein
LPNHGLQRIARTMRPLKPGERRSIMLTDIEFRRFFPFHWECNMCNCKSTFGGEAFLLRQTIQEYFKDTFSDQTIEEIPIFKERDKAIETIRTHSNGTSAFVCEVQGKCHKCSSNVMLISWVEFEKENLGNNEFRLNLVDMSIIDSDANLICETGLYRGVDIAVGLNDLFLRWFYMKGEITIVCPFIVGDGISYFDEIGNKITKTHNNIYIDAHIHNPFKRIITRDNIYNQSRKRFEGIEERLTDFILSNASYGYDKNLSSYIIPTGNLGAGLCKIFDENLYGVNIIQKVEAQLRDHIYYRGYFHGKLYGAKLGEFSEVVVSSYNYIDVETLQFESVALQQIESKQFDFQIQKMFDDNRLSVKYIEKPLKEYTVLWL